MKKTFKAFLSSTFALLMVISITSVALPSESSEVQSNNINQTLDDSFMNITENDLLSLSVNVNTANVAITDKKSNKIWYAFLPSVEENSNLSKTAKKSLQSVLNISYFNTDGNLVTAGSYAHSIDDGTFLIKKIKSGIEIVFSFEREGEGFTVPIDFKLNKTNLEVTVPYEKVKENKDTQICDIQILPNFGCGYITNDGYAFIPDGSGAIVDFKDAENQNCTYERQVYGNDMSQDLILSDVSDRQNIRMPVYGVKNSDSAYLAIIKKADSSSSIIASTLSGYTSVGSSFVYHHTDLTGIQGKESNTRVVTLTDDDSLKTSPVIEFDFLNKDKANYSGMAELYRSYLVNKYKLKKIDKTDLTSLNLEVFGGVKQQHIVAGFTFNDIKKATSLSDVINMQKDFKDLENNSVKWSLYGFTKGGYASNTVTSINLESKLGSTKNLKDLCDKAGKNNVFLSVDLTKMYNHSFQSFKNKNLIKSMNGLMAERHFTLPSNGMQKQEFGYWNYYNLNKFESNASKLLKNNKSNFSILYLNIGEEGYSDFRDAKKTTREDQIKSYQTILKNTNDKKVASAVESGNVYVLKDVDFISEVPTVSSEFDIESYTVPFYQMVLHGYVDMSTEALNKDSSSNDTFLKAMETGCAITYRLTNCNSYELKDTKLNFLYNTQYTDEIKSEITKNAKELSSWQKKIFDKCIVSNEIKDNLSITEYENGLKIIVNYSDSDITYKNQKINAKSYFIVENI